MNQTTYIISLILVALAVLLNRGNGNRAHQAVQLYLIVLVLLCTVVACG